MTEHVRLDRRGPVLWVILDRPEAKNALTPALVGQLEDAIRGTPPAVRCVILVGAGSDLCAGWEGEEGRQERAALRHLVRAIRECDAPVIVGIDGTCTGPGVTLAAACDVRLATDRARLVPATPGLISGIVSRGSLRDELGSLAAQISSLPPAQASRLRRRPGGRADGRPPTRLADRPVAVTVALALLTVPVVAGYLRTRLAGREPSPVPSPRAGSLPSPVVPDGSSAAPSSLVARATRPRIPVFERAGAPRPVRRLGHPTETGTPRVFLVRKQAGDWVKVLLPVRPNGTTGWVRAADVRLAEDPYRIVVNVSTHRIRAYRGDHRIVRAAVAVGTRDTPTPGGLYYITTLYKLPDPNTVYGTYAYGLSGFSDVLRSFNGGKGVIGLHGTNDPSVLGQDVSHGCIRMRNRVIERLVPLLPLGTPVRIVR